MISCQRSRRNESQRLEGPGSKTSDGQTILPNQSRPNDITQSVQTKRYYPISPDQTILPIQSRPSDITQSVQTKQYYPVSPDQKILPNQSRPNDILPKLLYSSKIVVLFYVLFILYSMYCLCVNVYCHRVTTQLQLTNNIYIYK